MHTLLVQAAVATEVVAGTLERGAVPCACRVLDWLHWAPLRQSGSRTGSQNRQAKTRLVHMLIYTSSWSAGHVSKYTSACYVYVCTTRQPASEERVARTVRHVTCDGSAN